MQRKRAEEIFKPIKPSSVKSDNDKTNALAEYRAAQGLIRERMANQRANRLSATNALTAKNRA